MNIHIELRYKQYVGDAAISKIIGMPRELYEFLSNAQSMKELAESEKARIKTRTSMGVDYLNIPFFPYAASTAKRKLKKNRYPGIVNLFDTGNMLGALGDKDKTGDFKAYWGPNIGTLSFATEESDKKAYCINEGKGNVAREFAKVSPNDEKNFVVILEKKIAEWQVKNG